MKINLNLGSASRYHCELIQSGPLQVVVLQCFRRNAVIVLLSRLISRVMTYELSQSLIHFFHRGLKSVYE